MLTLRFAECRPKIPEILSDPFFNEKYIPRALSSRLLTEKPQKLENLTPTKTPLSNRKRKLSDIEPLEKVHSFHTFQNAKKNVCM
jgi:hypothetical protein